MTETENNCLLKVDGLRTHFPIRKGFLKRTVGWVKAVNGVSFQIQKGTTLGLVGESGCGKTSLAKTILGLIPATAGSVYFDGIDVLARQRPQMKCLRRRMQIIFQDPGSSLNPRMTVGDIIAEPIRVHRLTGRRQVQSRVAELVDMVGLWPGCICRFPHEFSAGQRQRISIARALALEPELIICDEPVSALDIAVRLQIINLLQDLQERLRLGLLFIAHDLSVVELLSDYVAVMYMGRIVEYAQKERLFQNPLHPYTRLLLSSVPVPDPKKIHRPAVSFAEVASSSSPPAGCVFSPRCPLAEGQCRLEPQELKSEEYGHFAACRRSWQSFGG